MGVNQIGFIGLISSMGCYKLPSGVVCEKGQVGVSFLSWIMCAEDVEDMEDMVYRGTSGISLLGSAFGNQPVQKYVE